MGKQPKKEAQKEPQIRIQPYGHGLHIMHEDENGRRLADEWVWSPTGLAQEYEDIVRDMRARGLSDAYIENCARVIERLIDHLILNYYDPGTRHTRWIDRG